MRATRAWLTVTLEFMLDRNTTAFIALKKLKLNEQLTGKGGGAVRAFLYVCVEIQSLYSDKPLTTNLKNKDTFGNIISVPKGAGKETLPRCGT